MLPASEIVVSHLLSVAPMMRKTDRHFRFLMRQISKHVTLYTEMITAAALIHGDRARFLKYDQAEHPVVCQLGGDDPRDLAQCAKWVEEVGYDEVNLNIGCPSERVQSGNFGACLMRDAELVRRCCEAMIEAVEIPVTVKHRIGVDDHDSYEDMFEFVDIVSRAGVTQFSVHARKAWLKGLSPKQNRNVPPLRYEDVYRLKEDFPNLVIEINGGITDWDTLNTQLERVDAVMIGRAAYDDPMMFAQADRRLFAGGDDPTRSDVVEAMLPYIERELSTGTKLSHITDHMMNLFKGQPGGRAWRRALNECHGADSGVRLIEVALSHVQV